MIFSQVLRGKGLGETRFVSVGSAGVIGGLECERCVCVEGRGVTGASRVCAEKGGFKMVVHEKVMISPENPPN
jgi:hypothetical protein